MRATNFYGAGFPVFLNLILFYSYFCAIHFCPLMGGVPFLFLVLFYFLFLGMHSRHISPPFFYMCINILFSSGRKQSALLRRRLCGESQNIC